MNTMTVERSEFDLDIRIMPITLPTFLESGQKHDVAAVALNKGGPTFSSCVSTCSSSCNGTCDQSSHCPCRPG